MREQDYKITSTQEYADYTEALCRLASRYVVRIRAQFADKAYEMYQNETVRKIVLAYGEEAKKLDKSRLMWFRSACRDGVEDPALLKDDCLNHAESYRETLNMLFEIS